MIFASGVLRPLFAVLRRVSSGLSLGLGARDSLTVLCINLVLSLVNDSEGIADASELNAHFTPHDLQRLDLYAKQMVDHHLVPDLLPALGQLCFRRLDVKLSLLQAAIVLGLAEEGDRHDRQRFRSTYVPGTSFIQQSHPSSRPRFGKSARRTCATSSWV